MIIRASVKPGYRRMSFLTVSRTSKDTNIYQDHRLKKFDVVID
jgi:hypothetical protein